MTGRLDETNQPCIAIFFVMQDTIRYFELAQIARPSAGNEISVPVVGMLYYPQSFLGQMCDFTFESGCMHRNYLEIPVLGPSFQRYISHARARLRTVRLTLNYGGQEKVWLHNFQFRE